MLGGLLGFGGRIGRLRFFLLILALGCVAGAAIMALAFSAYGTTAGRAAMRAGSVPPAVMAGGLFVVMPLWLWFFLAFHAKRVRDIGWSPLYVLAPWVVFNVADMLAAPAGGGSGSGGIGSLVNFGFFLVLLFWPGRAPDRSEWTPPSFGRSEPAVRPASATVANLSPAVPGGFGRRRS